MLLMSLFTGPSWINILLLVLLVPASFFSLFFYVFYMLHFSWVVIRGVGMVPVVLILWF